MVAVHFVHDCLQCLQCFFFSPSCSLHRPPHLRVHDRGSRPTRRHDGATGPVAHGGPSCHRQIPDCFDGVALGADLEPRWVAGRDQEAPLPAWAACQRCLGRLLLPGEHDDVKSTLAALPCRGQAVPPPPPHPPAHPPHPPHPTARRSCSTRWPCPRSTSSRPMHCSSSSACCAWWRCRRARPRGWSRWSPLATTLSGCGCRSTWCSWA